jgi:acyl dehydratase
MDQRFVGRTYPPDTVYEVSREKIAEFAAAAGDSDPVYVDAAAARALGHPNVIAPPTFSTILTLRASQRLITDPELGLDYDRVVHGAQRCVMSRPIALGDRLVVTTVVDDIRSAVGNDLLSTRFEIVTEAGEPVQTVYSTLVARGSEA